MRPDDNKKRYEKYDTHFVAESIALLPEQCRAALAAAREMDMPAEYGKVKNIVIVGMGGSFLGPHIVYSVFKHRLTIPVTLVGGYTVPGWVGKDTLVVLSSYSGTTEEVLSAFSDAKKKHAKIAGIAVGGELESLCRGARVPFFKIIPAANPSGAPRLGGGYLIVGIVGMLSEMGFLDVSHQKMMDVVDDAASAAKRFAPRTAWLQNQAKQLARDLHDKLVLVVGAEHLEGNAHAFANQINESGKQFAVFHTLPELNHHLLEGLSFPREVRKKISVVFLQSNIYHPRVGKRFAVTAEVFMKQRIKTYSYNAHGRSRLGQALEALVFSGFVSFYLAMHNKVDPSAIPWVDYFKKKLA